MPKQRRSKPELEPISVYTSVIRPPEWKDQKAALQYLEGGFADHLHMVHDLLSAGVFIEPMILEDLAYIAGYLASFIPKPRPLVLSDESMEYVEELTRSIVEIRKKLDRSGVGFTTTDGLAADVYPETLSVLASALTHASTMLSAEAHAQWNGEMEYRGQYMDLRMEQARIRKKLREIDPEAEDAD